MGGESDQSKSVDTMLGYQMQNEQNQSADFISRNTRDTKNSQQRTNQLYQDAYGGYKSLSDPTNFLSTGLIPGATTSGGGGGGGGGSADGGRGTDTRFSEAENAYRRFMGSTGGWDPSRIASMDTNIAGLKNLAATGGGITGERGNDPNFGIAENSYKNFINTGGWDPNQLETSNRGISGLMDIGATGGVNAADQTRARGGGVYDEFGQTGGYNAGDLSNIRRRSTSGIPAFYGQMKNEAARLGSIQGGYGPGRAAMMGRLGRDQAAASSDAALNAELGIKSAVNTGRLAGAAGMAQSEQGLQGLLTGNKLAGLTAGTAAQQAQAASTSQGKQFGTTGIAGMAQADRDAMIKAAVARGDLSMNSLLGASGVESGMMNSIIQGQMYGTSGLQGMAEADRQAALAASAIGGSNAANANALAQQQSNWANQFNLERQTQGLSGLTSLYNSTPAEYNANLNLGLQNRATTASNLSGMGGVIKGNQNNGSSGWQTAAQIGGTLGAAAIVASSRTLKEDIKPLSFGARKKLAKLPLYTWRYKGDPIKHVGPMAEEFKSIMGVGDGKTIHVVDVMGSLLAAEKERIASHA